MGRRQSLFFSIARISRAILKLGCGAALLGERAFAEEAPANILRAAKEQMHGKPWRVEALVQGEKGFKVAGIIAGKDFDLTVETAGGKSRQIALGEQGWSSTDGGKTWKKSGSIDRRHYFITHTPIKFRAEEKIPPFEKVETSASDGEELLHVRFIAPDKVAYEGDRPNVWIAMDRDKPIAIRRYAGPLGFENEYVIAQVRYAPVAEARPIVPPPGNPAAAPAGDDAGALLGAALRKMQTGVWEVDATVSQPKKARVHGLIAGREFDLTMEPEDGGNPIRQITMKDRGWASFDGAKTWTKTSVEGGRSIYHWVHGPIDSEGVLPPFESVGREERNGAPVLHLRLKVSEKLGSEKERPHYWIALNPEGQAQSVRRYEGNLLQGEQVIFCEADYRPAGEGAAIKPPTALVKTEAGPPPPIEGKTFGFFDIEAQKFELAGRVVRVEITGTILGSEPIGGDQLRAMVKDTGGRYGQVEFPRAGLEKLGLSKDYSGKPVSLYLLITPQGKEPAAKSAAVGSKFTRGADGKGQYEW